MGSNLTVPGSWTFVAISHWPVMFDVTRAEGQLGWCHGYSDAWTPNASPCLTRKFLFSCWTPATSNLIVCLGKRLCKWPTKRSVSIEMWTYRRVATFWTIFSFDCRIQAASTRVRRSGSWHRGPMCPSQRNSLEVRKPWTASTWLIYARLWHHSNSISTQLMVDNPSPK
jgi:hypothetical protein